MYNDSVCDTQTHALTKLHIHTYEIATVYFAIYSPNRMLSKCEFRWNIESFTIAIKT